MSRKLYSKCSAGVTKGVNHDQSCGSLLSGGGVNQESVDAKEEDKVAASDILQAFKQQVFHLEFIEPECIDGIDDIEKEVAPQAHQNQRLS